ncbi:MAG: THUMP domain-containing protein [Methanosarcinales archaeon]|jgi:tRNA (guanine10-N2)-dimethyltransferase|nr:THUMP domain-containing protein [Methanosarcinales archaeon]
MLYAFELSGEHPLIPAAEVLSVLSSYGLEYSVFENYLNCIIVDIFSNDPAVSDEDIFLMMRDEMPDVLAMTHAISKVIEITDVDEEAILTAAERFCAADYLNEGETFVVRAKRLGDNSVLKSVDLEGRIGGRIFRQGFRASLKSADVTFRLTLTDKAVFGVLAAVVDRGAYEHRSPQKKPFFYPGVLMPRVARALSNIAGAKKDAVVVDPFCGTAGILLEAGLLGAKAIGVDAQEKIIIGAASNMDGYAQSTGQLLSKEERESGSDRIRYDLFVGDACSLPFCCEIADAVITDPPYGRSAAIKAESLERLYDESFKEMFRVLKSGKKAVVVSEIEVESYAREAGFHIENIYKQRVHKSLTRTITVLSKA